VAAGLHPVAADGHRAPPGGAGRERLVSGSLADLTARDHVVGVTTNPSIFAKAITSSNAYDAQLRDLATRGVDAV